MGHDAVTLATFNADADTRMVWAVHRNDPSQIVYVRDDEVDAAYRAWTKETLGCIVPGCTVPLTAAHRARKRDGFVHLGQVDPKTHRPESVLHQQGKAALLTWVRTTYPDVQIDPEVPLEGGVRRPDVFAVSPNGNKLAFEVQYAGLSVQEWQVRHVWYVAHDIVEVWLWGHTGVHFRRSGEGASLNVVQETAAAAGVPIWWINPLDNTIAWAGVRTNPPGRADVELVIPATRGYVTHVNVTPLTDVRLARDGLRTNEFSRALDDRDRLGKFGSSLPANPLRVVAPARAIKSLKDKVLDCRPVLIGSDDAHAAVWEQSEAKRRAFGLYGPDVFDAICVEYPEISSSYVGIDHRYWQTAAYLHAVGAGVPLKSQSLWIKESDFGAGVAALGLQQNPAVL